jgi:hypothetical protein
MNYELLDNKQKGHYVSPRVSSSIQYNEIKKTSYWIEELVTEQKIIYKWWRVQLRSE